jgi:alkyl sulfatase BDS1-like metallo-beta-lactamase superfamily hydrolase
LPASKPATPHTARLNAEVAEQLPFDDTTDFENARRGLVVEASGQIMADTGHVAWDMDRWGFLDGEAPPSVHPSLWRQGRLNAIAGIFEVAEGIYQARGFDLAVMTFLRTDGGWIVVDPLVTVEPARAALALVRQHVADLPVVAVLYTHSHADHFGGVRGVVTDEDLAAGRVRIIAPVDFLEEAVSENVLMGNVMSRRASYMYGNLAGWGPHASVGAGLAQLTSAGAFTLLPPTDHVSATGEELVIDGLRIVFQHTPGAEAPAELCFYLPERRALCMAEIASHALHNVYTLRGAKIRDALAWSRHINDAIHLFGRDVEVEFGSHHWPTWGNAEVLAFLKGQRDLYRYIHDETLRLANHGYGPSEIADMVELPDGIAQSFANRGYYGSVSHNVRAVYTYYLGFFDGNPATLNPLPPVDGARKAVEYMGGADAVLARARADFERGEYRWVAQAVNNVVFADPGNVEARALQADTLEQLGYQSENGTWRNFYLSAAKELRDGVVVMPTPSSASPDAAKAMSVEMFLQFLAVRLNGPKAADRAWTFDLAFTDLGERYLLEVENGVLNFTRDAVVDAPTATISLTRAAMDAIVLRQATFADLRADGSISVAGDAAAVEDFLGLLDTFEFWFNIATP